MYFDGGFFCNQLSAFTLSSMVGGEGKGAAGDGEALEQGVSASQGPAGFFMLEEEENKQAKISTHPHIILFQLLEREHLDLSLASTTYELFELGYVS